MPGLQYAVNKYLLNEKNEYIEQKINKLDLKMWAHCYSFSDLFRRSWKFGSLYGRSTFSMASNSKIKMK